MVVTEQHSERMTRVLDAAAELLVRWGYQRVTIDEVARRAGVGKGTVYLHFPTKDALFLAVLLRAHKQTIDIVAARMDADPEEAMPSRLLAGAFRHVAADPLGKALYLGDPEMLGRLSHAAEGTMGPIVVQRDALLRMQLEQLRAAGRVRVDLPVADQAHVLSAVGAGFFFVEAQSDAAALEARAELMAYTIAATIELPGPPPVAAAPVIAAGFREINRYIEDELQNRVR